MTKKPHKVTVHIPNEFDLTEEEISTLREKFNAHIVETLENRGEGDQPVVDDITRVIAPRRDDA